MPPLEHFNIVERDGLRLITPKHESAGNAAWTKDTLKYRSRIETLDGETVSQGFPKFFNLGFGPEGLKTELDEIVKEVVAGNAWATLKIDGSLLIRSVYQGKVMLRTRGSFGYQFLPNGHEVDEFYKRYPKIWDATYAPNISFLFEWVSPENTIVIKYPKPELTLLGAIDNTSLEMYSMISVEVFAEILGVPHVPCFRLTPLGWKDLYDSLETDTMIEGYVIRYGQNLVKVKCAAYLTKHALKSSLDTEGLVSMYLEAGKPTFEEFVKHFTETFDEEVCMWAYGAICALYDGIATYNKIVNHMRIKVYDRRDWIRKDVALTGLAEYGQTKRFSLYMKLWEGQAIPKDLEKSVILQNTKQVELGMFKEAHVSDSNVDLDSVFSTSD